MGVQEKEHGKLCRHLNACGYKQVEGVHYNRSSSHTPVTNAGTIQIVIMLMLMANWLGWMADVNGKFLHWEFKDGKVIYMKVPHGFEKLYPNNVVLKLKKFI
jgi:hypothetical protein